jgi:RNA polymerase sigma factor (sigma-70 family)
VRRPTDEQLLEASPDDADAFAAFYRRHVRAVVAWFRVRVRDAELAADLAAETFAAALIGSRGYDPGLAPGRAWLFAIARNKLVDSFRRGQVEDDARRRLRMRPLEIDDEDLARVEEMASAAAEGAAALAALDELTEDQRVALGLHVLEDRDYAEIAHELRCSEQVVRKRVSRGLARLRARMEGSG